MEPVRGPPIQLETSHTGDNKTSIHHTAQAKARWQKALRGQARRGGQNKQGKALQKHPLGWGRCRLDKRKHTLRLWEIATSVAGGGTAKPPGAQALSLA
jgi:hypothetical protein